MENINITWWGDNGNWGDILNPHLVSLLSGIDSRDTKWGFNISPI